MKNLLAKFYKSLICRVAWALITTATAANAHDLPQHFPHAPTDWGMIQQDCLGYYDRAQPTVHSDVFSKEQLVEIAVVQPDAGNPPEPLAMLSNDRDGSAERIGPALFDGVDCADLESFYRSVPSNESIELTQESSSPKPFRIPLNMPVWFGLQLNADLLPLSKTRPSSAPWLAPIRV